MITLPCTTSIRGPRVEYQADSQPPRCLPAGAPGAASVPVEFRMVVVIDALPKRWRKREAAFLTLPRPRRRTRSPRPGTAHKRRPDFPQFPPNFRTRSSP